MKRFLAIALLLAIPFAGFAQDEGPVAVLEYFDNPDGVFVVSADGDELWPEYGMELLPGDKVRTTTATAEIRLDPNQSLIKLANRTEFIVDTLQNRGGAQANTFSLVSGKIRGVFAKDGNAQYQIATQTAVCGVRGTKLGIDYQPGETASMLLESGAAAFTNLLTGVTLDLEPGQFADALGDTFEAVTATSEQISQFFEGIESFEGEGLDENAVPGNEPPATEEPPAEEPPEEETVVVDEPTEQVVTEEVTAEEAAEAGLFEPIMDWLREALGMEIGTITIDDKTYSKALIQPEFAVGRLKMGLYLPVIYETNMFDPDDWYRPRGNDEWSFGTDAGANGEGWSEDPAAAALDAASDLFLKIRYLEWGEQRDKFFFKVGNLDTMTIGHGILMRNYANDADFPSVRRIGVNLGIDLGGIGIETVVNDVAEPEIMGGRLYLRPFGARFGLAVGASAIVDIDPADELPRDDPETEIGGPVFINMAVDLDMPIVETDFLSIVVFGDIGGMMPYYRTPVTSTTGTELIPAGFYTQALFVPELLDEGRIPLNNYGVAAGVFGNVFILDYRIEYRNFTGTFRPAFYGPNYDRLRYGYPDQLTAELLSNEEIVPTVGIYGEAGFSIGEKFYLEAGYMWPWVPGTDELGAGAIGTPGENDELHITAVIEKGLIPVLDLHGSFSYDRTNFIPAFLDEDRPENLTTLQVLFDANTTMAGEVVYPVAESLDVAILVTTNAAQDDEGNVILNPDNGLPEISPSISIETRVHF